jgi:hypothetical protein
MRMNKILSAPLLVGLIGAGCVMDAAPRSAFDGCAPGEACGGLTTCQATPPSIASGNLCTRRCSAATDCGPDAVCVAASGGVGQCFRRCITAPCPFGGGTMCKVLPLNDGSGLQTRVCVPDAGDLNGP